MEPPQEAPTLAEITEFAKHLPLDEGIALLRRVHVAPSAAPAASTAVPAGEPVYTSWEDYLGRTTVSQRMLWCRKKAERANRKRLMSAEPDVKISGADVWALLEAARGRCEHCGSLAVETRPSTATGQPSPWEHVGRRIGSLGHRIARFNGGSNAPDNLCWSCLWCNTWPSERWLGATDHGGLQPPGALCGIPGCGVVRPEDADLPLLPDQCPDHDGALGELCATCRGIMRTVRREHWLGTRISLREEYRQQHNKCAQCDALLVLPTVSEIHRCRTVVTAPFGDKGSRARMDSLWGAGVPGHFTYQPWVEDSRSAAGAAGLAADEYVLMTAQSQHRCSGCAADAGMVSESVARIREELAQLRRVHGSLYPISFDPLSLDPWQARAIGTRRKALSAESPGGLRRLIGDDKRRATARRASVKTV